MVVLNFVLMAILFGHSAVSSINLNPKEFPFLKTQINDEKHAVAFNKLLNSIVKTNQKRLDAINKLNKLQAADLYPSLQDNLRASRRDSDESDDSDEAKVIYLVIPDLPAPQTPPAPTAQNPQRSAESPSTERPNQPIIHAERQQTENLPSIPTLQDYATLKSNPIPNLNETLSVNQSSHSSIQTISKDGLDALRQNIERSCKSKEVKRCKNACQAAVKSACEEYSCKKKLKKKLKKACKRECKEEFRSGW